ncbi:ADAMTS-like protein 1 [Aphelenchoides bicaudatus]|nr:ADAMTS-like protein 1 [Aphelenchoides bicaudatus]
MTRFLAGQSGQNGHRARKNAGTECNINSEDVWTCVVPARVRHVSCNSNKSEAEQECIKQNSASFNKQISNWVPSQQKNSCSVNCALQSKNEILELEILLGDGSGCQRDDAKDGTCLNGKCQPVGCDHIIGSSLVVDQCGVCAGVDGRECQKSLFNWKETGEFSACDKSCGSDRRQLSISVCVNSINNRTVPKRMCADLPRLRPTIRSCPYVACPAKWWTGAYSRCSKSCGVGTQKRPVYCIENGDHHLLEFSLQNYKVDNQHCFKEPKPESVRQCSMEKCKNSKVKTTEKNGRDTSSSAGANRFVESQYSRWNSDGFSSESSALGFSSSKDYFSTSDSSSARSRPHFVTGTWSECSKTCGNGTNCDLNNLISIINLGIRTRTLECVATQDLTGTQIKLPDFECDNQVRPNVFQPCELAACVEPQKNSDKSKPNKNGAYKWEYGVWGPCSASCLGGKQKSTLKCMDTNRNVAVPFSNCRSKQRPIELTRTCNTHICPPSWRVEQWSTCSHTCGAGLRSREVVCVKRVARDVVSDSTNLILPETECPQPKPIDQEACGLVDCPFTWRIEQWSPCSTTCGPGEQRRSVVCEQRDAQGVVHSFNPPLQCSGLQRPHTLQLCNLGSCNSEYNMAGEVNSNRVVDDIIRLPQALAQQSEQAGDENRVRNRFINADNTFDQTQPEHRKLTLNVGGYANVYEGTSIKIKCPARNFARHKITWTKNGQRVENSAHIKVSSNGALRIFHVKEQDAGLYECFANGPQGNLTLRFKARDSGALPHKPSHDSQTEQNTVTDDLEEMKPADVDQQLIQKVRESLYRLGEKQAYDKLRDVKEPGQLKLDYAIGDWSACSQTQCGQIDGAQVRLLRCRLMIDQTLAYVEDEICDSFGVNRPPASRSCSSPSCPNWDATEWTDCSTSRCLREGVSISRREVRCQYPNGTVADFSMCDRKTRPKTKKECPNTNCTAEWRSSIWGKCSKKCGDGGVQMRLLRCTWRNSKKAAGNNCAPALRPSTIRACAIPDLPACPNKDPYDEKNSKWGLEQQRYWASRSPDRCEDKSRFCSILKLFQLCNDEKNREKCCYSCHKLEISKGITPV